VFWNEAVLVAWLFDDLAYIIPRAQGNMTILGHGEVGVQEKKIPCSFGSDERRNQIGLGLGPWLGR
jgi:hypothetical protein